LRLRLYTPEWSERTYAESLRRARELLFEGRRVLIDATFREKKKRQVFLTAAARCGVPGGIFFCQAEPETVRRRLASRKGDASDADWAVYRQMAPSWEKPRPRAGQLVYTISTDGGPEQAAARALEALRQSGLYTS
jgi:predicted kinase